MHILIRLLCHAELVSASDKIKSLGKRITALESGMLREGRYFKAIFL
jgi:hypothetical protein